MQTPTRKLGQYSHLKPDPNLTREKYDELKRTLERLKQLQPSAADEVRRLAADGDFSENAPYQHAKGRLRGILKRITEIEDHLNRAVIIERPRAADRVGLGHRVTVAVNGKERTYTILGSSETDPDTGVISHNSPLGAALLGKRAGDAVEVQLQERIVKYIIIKIE